MAIPSVIAIDGPSAAGKTTIGRLLATKLGYRFVDTGAMYRALTWLALKRGIDPNDAPKLTQLAQQASIQFHPFDDKDAIFIDDQDVTEAVRDPEVEANVSLVSRIPGVREAMVLQQKRLAQAGGVVMAGRDIGTVVLPHAPLKVFLIASTKERARRRYQELREQGKEVVFSEVMKDMEHRDEIDISRAISPLRPASDASIIETDGLTLEQVLKAICQRMSPG